MGRIDHVLRIALITLVALMAGQTLGRAQEEAQPAWTQDLRDQLMQEKNCELGFMSSVRELEFFDGVVANGRAHCLDKRQFDFTWAPKKMKFDISQCGTAVC